MINLENQKVCVTGSNSMLGRAICSILKNRKAIVQPILHSKTDLCDLEDTYYQFNQYRSDYVIHLATYSGNIQFNLKHPADTYFRTTTMGLNVLESARRIKVKKIVSILSSCAIADLNKEQLSEDDLWKGLPNHTVESHGLAKRNLHGFSRQIYQQDGICAICCICNNIIGPHDNTDLHKTKVVMALIKRFIDAKEHNLPFVECWGSGNVYRSFIFVDDTAEAVTQVLERYNDIEPINLDSGNEISIKELAETIKDMVNYKGSIKWDTSKEDGQKRKLLDTTKMRQILDVKITPFREALRTTIEWYIQNKKEADAKSF